MPKKYATNNEAARALGMKPSAFAKGVRQGRFTASGKNAKGNPIYDLSIISKEYEQTKDAAFLQDRGAIYGNDNELRGGKQNRELTPILKAKTASETIKAQTQKLKLDALTGKLIEKDLAEKQGAELGIILMGALDSWAARLAPELASMKEADEHDFHLKITREVNFLKQEIIKKCSVETK
jgi:hypothetical protein